MRLRGFWTRSRAEDLTVEDELFAERLTEMLRDYLDAEFPPSATPQFRLPAQFAGSPKSGGPASSDPSERSRRSRMRTDRLDRTDRTNRIDRIDRARRTDPVHLEVHHEDPH